jgi:AraC-like DNA-binding protein
MTAQRLLKRGLQLKHVAYDVGYGSASALTRAFVRKLGCSPTEWIKGQQEGPHDPKHETQGSSNETRDPP